MVFRFVTDDENYTQFRTPIEIEKESLLRFDDLQCDIGTDWEPIIIIAEQVRKTPDFFFLEDSVFVVSERVRSQLLGVLCEETRFLPLANDEHSFFILCLTCFEPSLLDSERSVVERLPITGQITGIKKYSFKEDLLAHKLIFRITELPYELFITKAFVDLYHENSWEGLRISHDEMVWMSTI